MMKKSSKWLSLLLCGAMALSTAACAAPSAVPAATESPAVSEQPVQPSEQPAGGKFLPGGIRGGGFGQQRPPFRSGFRWMGITSSRWK